ncbi:MAG TPA: HlyD family secretion protein [Hyphomicrobiaceae bacterium]|jgi:membrane fusion protein (multidrug efflux system)|nr:HlyD family secretion protein [Hyphomicrobiaceae bacterium]
MLARSPWLERRLARVSARLPMSLRVSKPPLRLTLLVLVPAFVVAVGLLYYLLGGRYVSTDNAYVGAQKVLVTPEVSGKVVRIAVAEGQLLRPGDELFAIDEAPYRFAAQEAEARLQRVRTDFAALKASLASLAKQVEFSRQNLAAAQADFDRKTKLLGDRISSQSDLDRARVALMAAQAQLEQLEQQERTARIQLLGNPDLAIEQYPQFIEATVALDRARRDLANTVLRAPIAGVATQVSSIQMGRYLTAGMAVFSIVSSDSLWIDANPKETDLTHVRPGQQVAISVDAFPDRHWQGTVGAISPGTGAQFAILPPQNAAGNWIKIVQRVPVRIEFAAGQDLRRLRSGMSAVVEIDTGRRGRLASLLGGTAAAEADRE